MTYYVCVNHVKYGEIFKVAAPTKKMAKRIAGQKEYEHKSDTNITVFVCSN